MAKKWDMTTKKAVSLVESQIAQVIESVDSLATEATNDAREICAFKIKIVVNENKAENTVKRKLLSLIPEDDYNI